jgi:hypothetical protein
VDLDSGGFGRTELQESGWSEISSGTDPSSSSGPAGFPIDPPLLVELTVTPTVNYALAHNGVPLVSQLLVRNRGSRALADVSVSVELADSEGVLSQPWQRVLDLPPGAEISLSDVALRADPAALLQVTEQRPGEVIATVCAAGLEPVVTRTEIRVLAANQWLSASQILDYEMLSAFVMPNHPTVTELLPAVADLLAERTGRPDIDGYQSGSDRPDAIVAAVFEAMRSRGIRYIEPPASWTDAGQKVRTPAEVLEGGFATCLDTVVVMAAVLEQCGIRPLLWIVDGHAFLGYWRAENSLAQTVELDIARLVNLVDLGVIGVIETTLCTNRHDEVTLAEALTLPRRTWLGPDLAQVLAVVDVYRGRRNGILPLPARLRDADGTTRVVQYLPSERGATPAPAAATGAAPERAGRTPVPHRIQAWKNALLDLSLRNRLINLPAHRAGANLVVPEGALGVVEDMLNAGQAIRLLPSNSYDDVHAARGVTSARELPPEVLFGTLSERRAVYTSLTAETYQTKLRSLAHKARTIEEDTGANNLYVALGSLIWRFDDRELRSPLILVPVTLSAATGHGSYRITLDDSGGSTPNFCLLEKLRQVFGLSIPALQEPETDDSGIDLDRTFDQVRLALAKANISARVEASADLAILQFAKFRLWKDLDEHWEVFAENALVSHLIHRPTELFEDSVIADPEMDLDILAADLPIAADASQTRAVAQATAGMTFVLEGPPGTGKSQTITNLLAHAVAAGRRVLFVAEKRAALDVVRRRLDAVGMGSFALDLHDKASKPAVVRAQIRAALDSQVVTDEHGLRADREELLSSVRSLNRYAHRLHELNGAGLSLYAARERALSLGDGPALPVPATVLSAEPETIDGLRNLFVRLPEVTDEVRPRQLHPWGFLDDAELIASRPAAICAAVSRVDEAVEALSGSSVLGPLLGTIRTPDELSTLTGFLGRPSAPLELLDETRTARWQNAAEQARRDIALFVSAAHPGLDVVTPDALQLPLADIHARAQAAATSGFFGRKKRLRLVAAELAPAVRPGTVIEPKRLLVLTTALLQVQGALGELARRAASVPGLTVPAGWNPLTPAGQQLLDNQHGWLSWAGRQVDQASGESAFVSALRGLLQQAPAVPVAEVNSVREAADAFSGFLTTAKVSSAELASWADSRGLLGAWAVTRAGRGSAAAQAASLDKWLAFLTAMQPLRAVGMHQAHAVLKVGGVDADQASRAFERGLAQASLAERSEQTGLAVFDPRAQDSAVARFVRSSDAVRQHMHTEIPRRVLAARSFSPTAGIGQIGALQRELAKQRRGLGVRGLLAAYGELIVAAMPCVLVSPESVARFFPATAGLFDLVVFDEASQIRVADAIGAMGRARSVVVVGDSKQMPPTSFAEPAGGEADEDTADADLLAVEDEESILTECVQARVPRHWLAWHYRSQDEALIAFSNQHYYDNRLSSFPSPVTGPADPGAHGFGVSLVRVDGQFDRSGKGKLLRTNPVEAEAVVHDIVRRFAAHPDSAPSIGVVTFNAQQRALIDSMLRDLDDDRIVAALDDRGENGLFVKNLENVQGDERDVILFSVAFSRNDRGYLPLNFGPLNRTGGERRLNVAVTRARRQIVLFCSFDPSELRAEQTASVGIRHLRGYLEFAAALSGERVPELATGVRRVVDRHREEIAAALRSRGLSVRTDVGMSEFRIDLSLATAAEPDRPRVAVLLDGPSWAARATVGDRDGLPVDVLSNLMHWPDVRRIWLPEWLTDPGAVADRLVEVCRAAARPGTHGGHSREVLAEHAGTVPASPNGSVDGRHRRPDPAMLDGLALRPPGVSEQPAEPAVPVLLGAEEYRPWPAQLLGSRVMLDRLSEPAVRNRVVRVLNDVVAGEGPIHRERLARAVANAFDLSRLSPTRMTDLIGLIPAALVTDEGGQFVWPEGRTPWEWTGFRRSEDYSARPIEDIALREIGNAMVAVCAVSAGITQPELLREALRLFGGKRITPAIERRLVAALETAIAAGRIRRDGEVLVCS